MSTESDTVGVVTRLPSCRSRRCRVVESIQNTQRIQVLRVEASGEFGVPVTLEVPWHDFLRDVDWRGDHILLDFDSHLTVFDANDPAEPVFERDHDPLTSKAVLSPDGRWVFFHHGHLGRCLSTEDGAERWWQQFGQGLIHIERARWTSDGSSIVVVFDGQATRVHAPTGHLGGYLNVPRRAVYEISLGGSAIASCVTTLPGHPDQLCVSWLDTEQSYERGPRSPPCGLPPAEMVLLPDGACTLARVRWLDEDTVAVFNNRLHVVRGGAVVLSLSLARPHGDLWVRRDGGPFAQARVLPEDG